MYSIRRLSLPSRKSKVTNTPCTTFSFRLPQVPTSLSASFELLLAPICTLCIRPQAIPGRQHQLPGRIQVSTCRSLHTIASMPTRFLPIFLSLIVLLCARETSRER
ncbi:hypothetical protein CF319_g4142 [Tilletia indica]|nr:hypothetical protein CF319_g4142 [Tilletia indica]